MIIILFRGFIKWFYFSIFDAYNKKSFGTRILIDNNDLHTASSDGIIIIDFRYQESGYMYINIDQYQFFGSKGSNNIYGTSSTFPVRIGMQYKRAEYTAGTLYYIPFI